MSDLEIRRVGWEGRAAQIVGRRLLRGTAIVVGVPSQDLGGFVEIIEPSALERTFREGIDLRAFVDHDPSRILGRLTAKTLRAWVDEVGLQTEIDPPDTSAGNDIVESVRRGDVTGMSFAFRTKDSDPEWVKWEAERPPIVRRILDMRVYEVGPVSMPAYVQTDVSVAQRSLAQRRPTHSLAELQARMAQQRAGWR